MAYQTIFTIITIVCCSLYVSDIVDTGSHYFGNQAEWNGALKVCLERKERLPNVVISGLGLQLEDRINWSLGDCFWIAATYQRITDDTSGRFPTLCCGAVTKEANIPVFDCTNCDASLNYVCDSGHAAVLDNSGTHLPWKNAFNACHHMGLLLPNETNSNFPGQIHAERFWINDVRILNLSPTLATNDDIPLCFCNKRITNLKCPANVTTYCFPFRESLNEKNEATTSTNTRFHGYATLVGSLTVTAIAVVVTLIIVIIVIIKRIRRKRRANDGNSEAHMNTRSNEKVQAKNNLSYDTVLEDDLQMDSTYKGLTQIHTVLREPELHTQQQNITQCASIGKKQDHTIVGGKELPMYSTVQKGHRKKDNAEAIQECDGSCKEYDKIDFVERSVSESSGHVYDKAKIHHLGHIGEHDENVYNKADFSSNACDTNGSNVYDKGHFSRFEGSDYIAYDMKGSVDQTYDHI